MPISKNVTILFWTIKLAIKRVWKESWDKLSYFLFSIINIGYSTSDGIYLKIECVDIARNKIIKLL